VQLTSRENTALTTVQTRIREIGDKEDFDIIVLRDGTQVPPNENGVMGKYDFDRKMKGSKTVSNWLTERFNKLYPTLSCEVLNGDGTKASGQTQLKTVRETYEDL
jgi:hypothetical protein